MRGLATTVEHTVMMIISWSGNRLLYLLSVSSNVFMKLAMGTSVDCGSLLRTNLDFVFIKFVSSVSPFN